MIHKRRSINKPSERTHMLECGCVESGRRWRGSRAIDGMVHVRVFRVRLCATHYHEYLTQAITESEGD